LPAGLAGGEDALGDLLGELRATHIEQDRDERCLLVLADLRSALLGEGIDHTGNVRELLQPLVRGLDRLLLARVGDLPSLRVEDQRVAPVLLRREARREEGWSGPAVCAGRARGGVSVWPLAPRAAG